MKRPRGFVTRQAKRLSDGEINRRRFVMSALSAGVTMPTALSLASKAEAHVPRRGGVLRMGLAEGSARDTLDPARASNAFTRALASAQGNGLTEIDDNGAVAGALAQSLEPASGHRRWTLALRPGVLFRNGAPLTAEDVIATLDRHRQSGLLPDISTLDVLAPDRIAVTLTEGDAEFPRRLADPRLVILAKTGTPDRPIGTGPYRLERFEPGRVAELTRNPDYWKPGRAHFERVHLHALPDPIDRQTALMTGEIDYADRIDPRSAALLRQVPTLAVTEIASSRHLSLTFRDEAPFDRTDLRKALCRAVPGPALAERLLFGHGRGADLAGGFDLAGAARLFRRSGHDGPVPISVAEDPLARDAARLIAESAGRAGMVLTPTNGPAGCRIEIMDGPPDRTAETHVPLWINDIAAHVKTLAQAGEPLANPQNAAARLIERGWFA